MDEALTSKVTRYQFIVTRNAKHSLTRYKRSFIKLFFRMELSTMPNTQLSLLSNSCP